MRMTPEQGLELLTNMIAAPGYSQASLAGDFAALVAVFNRTMAPEPTPEKKRRRRNPGAKAVGWPAGLSRNYYAEWKQIQQAAGRTENLTPRACADETLPKA